MKKLILGCAVMLLGAICGTGWIIADSILVHGGAWDSVCEILYAQTDGIFIILFYAIAVVGAIVAVKSIKEDR